MPKTQIMLPARLTAPHLDAALKYFEATHRLSATEWKRALEAFDLLASATLATGRSQKSFRQFYESTVERRHAQRFLTELLAADDPETKGEALQRETATAILARLEQEGLYHNDVPDSEYLAAYCLYWWTSFARGYRFEAAVLRELQAAGIAFTAHDLRAASRAALALRPGGGSAAGRHQTHNLLFAHGALVAAEMRLLHYAPL